MAPNQKDSLVRIQNGSNRDWRLPEQVVVEVPPIG
jgi:hypothetical protein